MNSGAPIRKIVGIEADAQQIAGKETVLRRLNSNHANDEAVYPRENPAVPQSLSDENRGENGQQARNIIEMNHIVELPGPVMTSRTV